MKIKINDLISFRDVFNRMFPGAFASDIAGPCRSDIATTFYATSSGTVLVAKDSRSSLSRVIATKPCASPFACSYHWLAEIPQNEGHVDISPRGKLVEFTCHDEKQPRVLSLVARDPSTGWGSPVMGAVGSRFIWALLNAARLDATNGSIFQMQAIEIDGSRGTITTNSECETLCFSGFNFPWRHSIFLAAKDFIPYMRLDRQDPVSCGSLDQKLFVAFGPWRLRLPADAMRTGSYSDNLTKDLGRVTNHIQFDSEDLEFLLDHLEAYGNRIGRRQHVWLRLSDKVEVVVKNRDWSNPKRLILSRSHQKGKSRVIWVEPMHLRRLTDLGLTQLRVHAANQRISSATKQLLYICKTSPAERFRSFDGDAIEIDSVAGSSIPS